MDKGDNYELVPEEMLENSATGMSPEELDVGASIEASAFEVNETMDCDAIIENVPGAQEAFDAAIETELTLDGKTNMGTPFIEGGDVNKQPVGLLCPSCGSNNVLIQTVQENQGSKTVSKTKSKYKEGGHNLVWWLTIGWWWWIVDLVIWFVAFLPRLILRLFAAPFKKKKGKSKSKTVEKTKNIIVYKTICTCQNCAYTWEKKMGNPRGKVLPTR